MGEATGNVKDAVAKEQAGIARANVLDATQTVTMNPIILIVPMGLLMGGLVTFFLLPLDLNLRLIILVSDILAAGLVGFLLWRRFNG